MFDIGFWELVVIAVVALVVVGPERLPGLVRSVGYWIGRFRKIASTVKSELQQELDKAERLQTLLEEQKKIVERHELLGDLHKIEDEINDKPRPIPVKPKTSAPAPSTTPTTPAIASTPEVAATTKAPVEPGPANEKK